MPADPLELERLVQEIQVLSPETRLRLVGRIVDTLLLPSLDMPRRRLVYGEFHGPRLSCEEDFRLAEWRPDRDWDGP